MPKNDGRKVYVGTQAKLFLIFWLTASSNTDNKWKEREKRLYVSKEANVKFNN